MIHFVMKTFFVSVYLSKEELTEKRYRELKFSLLVVFKYSEMEWSKMGIFGEWAEKFFKSWMELGVCAFTFLLCFQKIIAADKLMWVKKETRVFVCV